MKSSTKCEACGLHKCRRKVVEPRVYGCEGNEHGFGGVLLIGDVPSRIDESLGLAGSSPEIGLVMADMMDKVKVKSYAVINMMKCRVTDSLQGDHRDPTHEEILACRPQLFDFIDYYQPSRIVLMGNLTHRFLASEFKDAILIPHPSVVVKVGGTGSGLYRTIVRKLQGGMYGRAACTF